MSAQGAGGGEGIIDYSLNLPDAPPTPADFMPADQVPLFEAATAAVVALARAREEEPLHTLWWLFACPMKVVKASYSSYYGTKEVWTVAIEHPDHAKRATRR